MRFKELKLNIRIFAPKISLKIHEFQYFVFKKFNFFYNRFYLNLRRKMIICPSVLCKQLKNGEVIGKPSKSQKLMSSKHLRLCMMRLLQKCLRSAMILFLWSFVQKNCIFFFVTSNVVRNISSANMVLRQSSKLYEYNRTTLSLFCYTLIAALNGNSQENAINLKNCILDKLHINVETSVVT